MNYSKVYRLPKFNLNKFYTFQSKIKNWVKNSQIYFILSDF